MRTNEISAELIAAARQLARRVDGLKFKTPVTHVYNPLDYAWPAHEAYLRKFGASRKRAVFLGMNPGPFGMVQTGIPFGEVAAARDWLKIGEPIGQPARVHPQRPVRGFDCPRSEVSGRRLWGLFAARFGSAQRFFAGHFVANYCPLAFCTVSGCNLTPDKLPASDRDRLFAACDAHLARLVAVLQPEWLIGVGNFAAERARSVTRNPGIRVGQILHPSPASPAANRNWAGVVTDELVRLEIWTPEK